MVKKCTDLARNHKNNQILSNLPIMYRYFQQKNCVSGRKKMKFMCKKYTSGNIVFYV